MFQQINNYFFRHKTVCIPGIGTFKLVQQPAMLDVANQQLEPPKLAVLFSHRSEVTPHQIASLASTLGNDNDATAEALEHFGQQFKNNLQQGAFAWQGVGSLAVDAEDIRFTAAQAALTAVPAVKVLRENAQHAVLIGDTEQLLYADAVVETDEVRKKYFEPILFGWLLVLLSAAFIIYYLYQHSGKVAASGLQQKIMMQATPVQHK